MRRAMVCAGLMLCVAGGEVHAQARSRGNPTPGTAQPDPPKVADRIALTGCVARVEGAAPTFDGNTPSDNRWVLTNARREKRVPPGTGTSPEAAASASDRYRLAGIEGILAPLSGMRVEISGEVEPGVASTDKPAAPILRVGFVKKLAASCQ